MNAYTYYSTKTTDKNRREPRSRYMTWTQKKEVMNNLNDSALVLLEFYYSKANVPKYDFKDSEVSNGIGWSESKVKKYRLSLEKKGYFHKEITRNSKSTTLNIIVGHIEWSEK